MIEQEAKQIVRQVNLKSLKGKTVMIAGASGLIGSYFLACLKQVRAVKVVAVIKSQPKAYWLKLADFKDVRIMRGDLTDLSFCQSLPRADVIIHAAGYGQPGRFLLKPLKTLKLYTLTTFFLLDKLKPGGKFLYISSSEIYSSSDLDHPRICYIEAKRAGETICQAAKNQGVNVKICRLSLAYGPGTRKDDQRVLYQLIVAGLKGEIQLLDNGRVMRTYCYVADSVEVMWQILLTGKETVYNVGGESRTSIADLAGKIGRYLKVKVIIPNKSAAKLGAPEDVRLDLSKIKKEFHKHKFVSLNEGLRRTINWLRQL